MYTSKYISKYISYVCFALYEEHSPLFFLTNQHRFFCQIKHKALTKDSYMYDMHALNVFNCFMHCL